MRTYDRTPCRSPGSDRRPTGDPSGRVAVETPRYGHADNASRIHRGDEDGRGGALVRSSQDGFDVPAGALFIDIEKDGNERSLGSVTPESTEIALMNKDQKLRGIWNLEQREIRDTRRRTV